MKIKFYKKLQLIPVFLIITFLWIIDRFSKPIFRAIGVFILSFILLTGFNVKAGPTIISIQNLPLLFADSPEVLGTQVVSYPISVPYSEFPVVTANSVLVTDLKENKVLVDINGEEKLPPASTTKLMTALVAMDIYKTSDYLKIPEFCTEVEGQKSGFKAGEIYEVEDLLMSLLMNSSADAACTLSISKVNYPEFIQLMNEKAQDIGMTQTNFTNPIGLDAENGSHVSTAYDLYKLTKKALEKSLIEEFVSTKIATIRDTEGKPTNIWNTNELLWDIPGTVGVKTGTTEGAGEVLIYRFKDTTRDILIIVMGSDARFTDTQKVLDWTLENYRWSN